MVVECMLGVNHIIKGMIGFDYVRYKLTVDHCRSNSNSNHAIFLFLLYQMSGVGKNESPHFAIGSTMQAILSSIYILSLVVLV